MASMAPQPTPTVPPLQRRYSVSGKTLPDELGAMKSPLQALDTSVQATSCGLCECSSGADSVRTSSKRSATQLPSPSTPSPQELPTKIARLGLDHDDMDLSSGEESCVTDPLPDDHAGWLEDNSSTAFTSLTLPPTSLPNLSSDHECDCDFTTSSNSTLESRSDSQSQLQLHLQLQLQSPPPPADEPSQLTLLTLPPELRHQIYLHLPDLVLPYPLIYCLSTFANKKSHPLASVSKQIRAEALAIFYTYNTWIIKLEFKIMYDAFQEWICRLGDNARDLRFVIVAVRGSMFKPGTRHGGGGGQLGMAVGLGAPALVPTNIQPQPLQGQQFIQIQPQPQHPLQVQQVQPQGGIVSLVESYSPPDGDASFKIDLSEKWAGGRVEVVRNDGTPASGEKARMYLSKLVVGLWEKRQAGSLNGQDWVNMVDQFLHFTGGGTW